MKKAKCFALVRRSYGQGSDIRAVTSDKESSWGRPRVWGRDALSDAPTNWSKASEEGRFNTYEEAEAALGKLKKALQPFKDREIAAHEAYKVAQRECYEERKRLIKEHSTYVGD